MPSTTNDTPVQNTADVIAKSPTILKDRIDAVNRLGVTGERLMIAMYFSGLDSRLLISPPGTSNVLAVKCSGTQGTGKSLPLYKCLYLYPDSEYILISNASPKSIYHDKKSYKHKALILAEAAPLYMNNTKDSELAYIIRSMISEGKTRYMFTDKDDNGQMIVRDRIIEGPTSFITTTIYDKLESQLEDRMFTVHSDESTRQTWEIIYAQAAIEAGDVETLAETDAEAWKSFHSTLNPVNVTIPYSKKIIPERDKELPAAARRGYKRLWTMIKTITCLYQHQRPKDARGFLIADVADYHMAWQIVQDALNESVGKMNKTNENMLFFIIKKGVVRHQDLKETFGLSASTTTTKIQALEKEGHVMWCDIYGHRFDNEADLKSAKACGAAFIRVSETFINSQSGIQLPSTYDVTGNSDWSEGGTLYRLYDLELNKRHVFNKAR